jgi:hypothetical protein
MATTKLRVVVPPATPLKKLTPEQLNAFTNWIPSGDSKAMAADLGKRGLIGADQLINDIQPNIITAGSARATQSAWKPAVILNILQKARQFGLKTLTELLANKDVLIDNPDYKKAVNHPMFQQIHPNWWQTIAGIYKDQLNKENATK